MLVNQIAKHKISQLGVGVQHVLALSLKGELFGWGDGTDGQILPNKKIVCGSKILQIDVKENILQIQCGSYSSSYLNDQFEVVKWGRQEKKIKQMNDLIYLSHKIEWNLDYEIIFLKAFRLPKQITSNLQNIKKRLLKMSKKMASEVSSELENEELQEIERMCIDCEQD